MGSRKSLRREERYLLQHTRDSTRARVNDEEDNDDDD